MAKNSKRDRTSNTGVSGVTAAEDLRDNPLPKYHRAHGRAITSYEVTAIAPLQNAMQASEMGAE